MARSLSGDDAVLWQRAAEIAAEGTLAEAAARLGVSVAVVRQLRSGDVPAFLHRDTKRALASHVSEHAELPADPRSAYLLGLLRGAEDAHAVLGARLRDAAAYVLAGGVAPAYSDRDLRDLAAARIATVTDAAPTQPDVASAPARRRRSS